MTKEELIKLSRENLRKSKQGSLCECYDEAFIKGYELSEKRIAELEQENAELKHRLIKVKEEIIKALKESFDYQWLPAHNGKAKFIYLQTVFDIVNEKFEGVKQ